MMFIQNKYYKWYMKIMQSVQSKNRTRKNGEFDLHHIIPKSMGGSNAKTNLVYLTHREHFIAHVLLVKCVAKPYIYKMVSALVRFKHKATSSRSYALYKTTISRYSKGEYNQSYGKIWCYNKQTLDIMFILKTEFSKLDPELYVKGLPYQRGGYRDRIWVHKDGRRAAIFKSELDHYLDNGWVRGRNMNFGRDHMVKMSSKRHTKEKDEQHSKALSGRIQIIDQQGGRKSVKPEELDKYLKNGYTILKGRGIKFRTYTGKTCSVDGVVYVSASEAASKLGIGSHVVRGRINNSKWETYYWVEP